jgi:murein DD-endopeptidase MepM/ murein hydrolase activator NlpD
MVWLDHGNGLRTLYAHLNAVLVERGQIVLQGQQVGRAGSSGHSTGPHLHFEVKQDMVKLDPLAFYPDGRAPLEEEFVVATSPSRSEEKRQ